MASTSAISIKDSLNFVLIGHIQLKCKTYFFETSNENIGQYLNYLNMKQNILVDNAKTIGY